MDANAQLTTKSSEVQWSLYGVTFRDSLFCPRNMIVFPLILA